MSQRFEKNSLETPNLLQLSILTEVALLCILKVVFFFNNYYFEISFVGELSLHHLECLKKHFKREKLVKRGSFLSN